MAVRSERSQPCFSKLERTVITLAAHPREWPRPEGRMARFLWKLHYRSEVKPLANPRLEALRLLASCFHSGRVSEAPGSVEEHFVSAGWLPEIGRASCRERVWPCV